MYKEVIDEYLLTGEKKLIKPLRNIFTYNNSKIVEAIYSILTNVEVIESYISLLRNISKENVYNEFHLNTFLNIKKYAYDNESKFNILYKLNKFNSNIHTVAVNEVVKHLNIARNWHEKSVQYGAVDDILYTGLFYDQCLFNEEIKKQEKSLGLFKKNLNKAKNYYIKAAKQGNIEAMYNLGRWYENNLNTEDNIELARYWYTKAIDNGDLRSKKSLECIENRELEFGIAQIYELLFTKKPENKEHFENAEFYYKLAVKFGHIKAAYALGDMYRYQRNSERDLQKAIYWYEKSVEQGNMDAMETLARLYKNKRELDNAIYWYEKIAHLEDFDAMNMLGVLYEAKGYDVQNVEEAIYWYKRSAKGGNLMAISNLGAILCNEKNKKKKFLKRDDIG